MNTVAGATTRVYGDSGDDTLSATGAGDNAAYGQGDNDTIANFVNASGGAGADTFFAVNARKDRIDCRGADGAVDVVHRDRGIDKVVNCKSNDTKLDS